MTVKAIWGERLKVGPSVAYDRVMISVRGPRGGDGPILGFTPDGAWELIRELADAAHEVERVRGEAAA